MGNVELAFLVGIIIGIPVGMFAEQHWGKSAEHVKRLRGIIHRMVPKLREYYTDEYVMHELIRGEDKHE